MNAEDMRTVLVLVAIAFVVTLAVIEAIRARRYGERPAPDMGSLDDEAMLDSSTGHFNNARMNARLAADHAQNAAEAAQAADRRVLLGLRRIAIDRVRGLKS